MSALLAGQALAFGPSDVLHSVLDLSGLAAYALVAFLAFAEAAIFIGFVLPGETAVVLGGGLAQMQQVGLIQMIVIVGGAAIIGDSVGYEVGRLYGDKVLQLRVLRKRAVAIDRAAAYLR